MSRTLSYTPFDVATPVIIEGTYRWLCTEENQQNEQEPEQAIATWAYDLASLIFSPARPDFAPEIFIDDSMEFWQLIQQWHRERGATSSTTEIVLCPAYQSIIGMGSKAISLILAQLESEGNDPDQWFWALQVLTRGANPVREEDEGNFLKMSQAWRKWAALKGYAW